MRGNELHFASNQIFFQSLRIAVERLRFLYAGSCGCHGIHAHSDSVAGVAQLFAGRDQKIDLIKSASEPAHHPPHEPNWQRQTQLPI